MKVSLNWLKDFVQLPSEVDPSKIAFDLTMSTVEVEAVHDCSQALRDVVVGQIRDVLPHPNADKLRIVRTDIGKGDNVQVVCGGSNLEKGMYVALALPGAKVRWHGQGELITLEKSKIRGEESFGMICAAEELGLSELFPMKSEKEIIDLSPLEKEIEIQAGLPLAELLQFQDFVFEIDNKSLTNRPDLWGHYGIARELSAIYGLELLPLPIDCPAKKHARHTVEISIEDTERASRYTAAEFSWDGSVELPFWMKSRLSLLGQRSIHPLVDLTNYVMFTVGQPMHVFDGDKLLGNKIIVRRARKNESCILLNQEVAELSDSDLVIADGERPVALAGIMGGLESAVSESSTHILLESASFDPTGIRKSTSRLGVRTDSSMRFEKGLDSLRAELATCYYLQLLCQFYPGLSEYSWADVHPKKPQTVSVQTSFEFIRSRIGIDLPADQIVEKLRKLQFEVESTTDELTAVVPAWRATGDIGIPEDLVEEVARLYGYDKIPFIAPTIELTSPVYQPKEDFLVRVRNHLAFSCKMHEIYCYPWCEDPFLRACGYSKEDCLSLHAPPSPHTECLQPSLVPNLLQAVRANNRQFESFRIFSISNVFSTQQTNPKSGVNEALPALPMYVAAALVFSSGSSSYQAARGAVDSLLQVLDIADAELVRAEETPRWAQAGSFQTLITGSKELGSIGLLSPAVAAELQIKNCQVAILQLSLEELLEQSSSAVRSYKKISPFPSSDFELSVVVPVETPWQQIKQTVSSTSPLITRVDYLDQYQGDQIAQGKKSVSLRYALTPEDHTLTPEEIEKVAQNAIQRLSKELGATLRGTL